MDMIDEDGCIPTEESLGPLYSWFQGDDTSDNLACSSSPNAFCFFCHFVPGNSGGADADLRAHCRTLIDQKKEVHTIVSSVARIYDRDIRPMVKVVSNGVEIKAPQWSKRKIALHLITSGEFEGLFDQLQSKIFQTMILRLQEKVVRSDGSISDGPRRALLSTMREYNTFKQQWLSEGPPSKRTKR